MKAWLKEDSKAQAALAAIVKKKSLLNDLAFLKKIYHAGNIEVFQSMCNQYCPRGYISVIIG